MLVKQAKNIWWRKISVAAVALNIFISSSRRTINCIDNVLLLKYIIFEAMYLKFLCVSSISVTHVTTDWITTRIGLKIMEGLTDLELISGLLTDCLVHEIKSFYFFPKMF